MILLRRLVQALDGLVHALAALPVPEGEGFLHARLVRLLGLEAAGSQVLELVEQLVLGVGYRSEAVAFVVEVSLAA